MSWTNVTEADVYFADSLESIKWASVANKSGAINSAFRVLSTHPAYTFPEIVSQVMKDANAEYALYLANNGNKRQALLDQGVKSFSIGDFSETLENTEQWYGDGYSLPSIVKQLLLIYENVPQFKGHFNRPIDRRFA